MLHDDILQYHYVLFEDNPSGYQNYLKVNLKDVYVLFRFERFKEQ